MQELDEWTDENILRPLASPDPNQEDWETPKHRVKKAIREKVLESYRNGCSRAAEVSAAGLAAKARAVGNVDSHSPRPVFPFALCFLYD